MGYNSICVSLVGRVVSLVCLHTQLIFVEVDFLWNRTVESLKTSFHLLL